MTLTKKKNSNSQKKEKENLVKKEEVPYYFYTYKAIAEKFQTDLNTGLSSEEAKKRFDTNGPNELYGTSGPSMLKVFLLNLFNPMNAILGIACGFSLGVRDWAESIVLFLVIITNTAIGFFQEYRSEKTMDALRKMASPTAKVLRNKDFEVVPSKEAVTGDIVILEDGDIVPADIRLFEAINLEADEALLTGETLPVSKFIEPIQPMPTHDNVIRTSTDDQSPSPGSSAVEHQEHTFVSVGDRKNMVFSSTLVTQGRGKGIVVATGLNSEVGKIASLVSVQAKTGILNIEKTPLQKTLTRMMFLLLGVAIILAIVVFGASLFVIDNRVLVYAIGVGVAILPEGLPAVLTVTMAAGVRRIAKQKAIVRRLAALEALGQVTNICSDKTGTLTEGKMVAKFAWFGFKRFAVSGKGIMPEGEITSEESGEKIDQEKLASDPVLRAAMLVSSLCLTCTLAFDTEENRWKATGDPTEVALKALSYKAGYKFEPCPPSFQFVNEYGFDTKLKRMSVVYKETHLDEVTIWALTKGAMERILEVSSFYFNEQGVMVPLTEEFKNQAHDVMIHFASKGMRVLALAFKTSKNEKEADVFQLKDRRYIESDLCFIGLVAIYDPPRAESAPSVQQCREAGVVVHMATGDHPKTAEAIAREVGIISASDAAYSSLVMTAAEFDKLDDNQIDELTVLPRVLARCSPESKVKLLEALQRRGKFVAMTGDGVNDAPAVKRADIGIAMGLGGSDVTKQASDITLTDDNFNTIVNAIREGRRLFTNSTRVALHLLSGNVSEVIALVIGLGIRDSINSAIFPMSAVQILWLNMITSSPVALALGMEYASKNVMQVPPRAKNASFWTRELLTDTFVYGFIMGMMALGSFIGSIVIDYGSLSNLPAGCNSNYGHENGLGECTGIFEARGVAFNLLSLLLLIHGLNCRDMNLSMLKYEKTNKYVWYSIILGFILTLPTSFIPGINIQVFHHTMFRLKWVMIACLLVVFVIVSEIYKALKRFMNMRKEREDALKQSLV